LTGQILPTNRFGPRPTADGVHFRLWAPGAERVDLILDETHGAARPMKAADDGWFERHVDDVRAGSRYRYLIDNEVHVPDPASRYQPEDVHGPSVVVDPSSFAWSTPDWTGRPWHETVLYELHVGTFAPEGTFDGVRRKLDHLADLGVTAVELMPVADFSGQRSWGYDGVLPFAPDSAYGTPDDLRRLVDEAHDRGLMMFLDVVYNHFGPDGNFLHRYAPQFFTHDADTPWGEAIDFSRREVRDFVIENALHWLRDYRFDGLRLDAVHAIHDRSPQHILDELAETVHAELPDRHIHLVLENEDNSAHYLRRDPRGRAPAYVAQWNDDIHHACHVLATGESEAYYRDFIKEPLDQLRRCLAEGFAYQGELSGFRGAARGERSADLPPGAFVTFLQNHDQVGNRAFGERLGALADDRAVAALTAIVLLAPSPPMLFMGEEWSAPEPFLFFCDFHDELAAAVRDGRRQEFAEFAAFRDPETRNRIPDPNALETFERSRLDWDRFGVEPHATWLRLYKELLDVRRREIIPRLADMTRNAIRSECFGARALTVTWRLDDGAELSLVANTSPTETAGFAVPDRSRLLYATEGAVQSAVDGNLPAWSTAWFIADSDE